MLQRAEDVPTYAGLLGRYGDPAAIDILKSFASEVDINYVEFVEIRNAVEELGGEMTEEKIFGRSLLQVHKSYRGKRRKSRNRRNEKLNIHNVIYS